MGFFDIFFGGETLIDVEKSQVAPGYVEASHILLRSDESDAEADALLARIQSGEMSFGDAASEFSACPSRNKKGFLGQFTSLSSILFLPYEGKDTAAFDALVKSPDTQLKSPYKVKTSFGAAAQSPLLGQPLIPPCRSWQVRTSLWSSRVAHSKRCGMSHAHGRVHTHNNSAPARPGGAAVALAARRSALPAATPTHVHT